MLISNILSKKGLLYKSTANSYIYLRDHNKHINPSTSILKVSYRNPNNFVPDMPQHKFLQYPLTPDVQNLLDRQIFQEYKNKILRGIVDQQKLQEPDPLWGEEPAPSHYFTRISKIDLMRVSHPQNNDAEPLLQSYFQPFFESQFTGQITSELIKNSDVHQLVELSLAARKQEISDGQIWFSIERGFNRGKNLYLLSSQELVKLKCAFDDKIKQGTPIFHEILSSLLKEDLNSMNKELLLSMFYACRYANPNQSNLQYETIQHLRPLFQSFTFQQKVDFLLAVSLCTKPIKYNKKVHKKRANQFKQLAASLILQLNFWDLPFTHQTTSSLIFALAKLQIQNTKFITYPLRDYILDNFESYCEDNSRLYQALTYLGQLQAGLGIMDQELAGKLRSLAEQKWGQFSSIQQMRIVHSLWNLGLMDQPLLQLYKTIQLQSDTTLLYYASQIQLNNSSQRQWQIIQCLAHIQVLPLPYFTAFKRFYNYIKATTNWDLTPLADKLRNTEYYYSVMRQEEGMLRVRPYQKLREFQDFSGVSFSKRGAPISNLEFAHFGFPHHKVSLDIASKKHFIPGTDQLKESYMNKVRSLKNIGWKHLAFTQAQLESLSLTQIIGNIQHSFEPYIEQQQAIIDFEDYQAAQKVETYKHIDQMKNWQLEDINRYISKIKGEEYIELGEQVKDEMNKGLDQMEEESIQRKEPVYKKKKK